MGQQHTRSPSTSVSTTRSHKYDDVIVQNVLLIWLHNYINDIDGVCHNTVKQLHRVVNLVEMFTDLEKCMQFIHKNTNERICLIISDSFDHHAVSRFQKLPQVDTIFIFTHNKNYHGEWTKQYSKIEGVYYDISTLCEILKHVVQTCEQNSISFTFAQTDEHEQTKTYDDCFNKQFMHVQIVKEILLTIDFQKKHIDEFVEYCRTIFIHNNDELKNIDDIATKYQQKKPIWWYTCGSFLNSMLNYALRVTDMNILIRMGFFIVDLHRHIEDLHKEQCANGNIKRQPFTVFHGQAVSKSDYENLTKAKHGLIGFKNFLFASKTKTDLLSFVIRLIEKNNDLIGILFSIDVDVSKSTIPFVSVENVAGIQMQTDILFSMHTVFRIRDVIARSEHNNLFQVNLSLMNDDDHQDFRKFNNRIKEESYSNQHGWYRLGSMLQKMGHSDISYKIFENLLEQTKDDNEKAQIHQHLAWAKYERGDYDKALNLYLQTLDIQNKYLSTDHIDFAMTYNSIGLLYDKMGETLKALAFHEKALGIQNKLLPSDHMDIAATYINIAIVYRTMGKYSKAILYFEKALAIKQRILSPTDLNLASSFNNIGGVYYNMGEYTKSLAFHLKALEIQQESLPLIHLDLATTYNNIGVVYRKLEKYPMALSYYEKALEIKQKLLPINHSSLAMSYGNIGIVYGEMGEYTKALQFHEKDVEISKHLPKTNHLDLASTYNNIAVIYKNMGDCLEALSYYNKALEIRKHILPPNHSDIGGSYSNIGLLYEEMNDYSKAYLFLDLAFRNGERCLPINHPSLLERRKHLERVKKLL